MSARVLTSSVSTTQFIAPIHIIICCCAVQAVIACPNAATAVPSPMAGPSNQELVISGRASCRYFCTDGGGGGGAGRDRGRGAGHRQAVGRSERPLFPPDQPIHQPLPSPPPGPRLSYLSCLPLTVTLPGPLRTTTTTQARVVFYSRDSILGMGAGSRLCLEVSCR